MASECSVRVVCRYRPQNSIEDSSGGKVIAKFPSRDSVSHNGRVYNFDRVFHPDTTQEEVYKEAAQPIVQDVLNGFNGTIFAYGQTSSGKTHTMEGVLDDEQYRGVIPRIISDIFAHIYAMDHDPSIEILIKVSYFEIYMEKIRDLLDVKKTNLSVHEGKDRVPYVKDLTERYVGSADDVFATLDEGKNNRHVSATHMNLHSSRSHSVLLLNIKQMFGGQKRMLNGKLYLVDLAGSEKVSKTGAEGLTLDEAKNINKSLSALGLVISALTDEKKRSHVPYRDSKLTRILQESLGGNSRTTMVICCSPSSFNEFETKSTLDFGKRAKSIKNTVVVNEELTAEEWRQRYEKEKQKNSELEKKMKVLQAEVKRWRSGESIPASEQANLIVSEVHTESEPTSGSLTADERQHLYAQLDEKDGELNKQAQETERLKQLSSELQELLDMARQEAVERQGLLDLSKQEGDKSRDEVKEVLKALEDLALNYETKAQQVEEKVQELASLRNSADMLQNDLAEAQLKISNFGEEKDGIRMQLAAILNGWFDELTCMATDLEAELTIQPPDVACADEESTRLRLQSSSLRTRVKLLFQRCKELQEAHHAAEQGVETRTKELSDIKLVASQHEVDLQAATKTNKDLQSENQALQKTIDSLNTQMAILSAKVEQVEVEKGKAGRNADDIQALQTKHDKIVESLQKEHQDVLSRLRHVIEDKQQQIHEQLSMAKKQELENTHLKAEMDELRGIQRMNTEKIASLTEELERPRQAGMEMWVMKETVEKELKQLLNMKQSFVQTMQRRTLQRRHADDAPFSPAAREKIVFLENNLEQLTARHKQFVQEYTALERECGRLKKRIEAKANRVKSLEAALNELKKENQKEKQALSEDLTSLKRTFEARLRAQSGFTNIVKPIRPGQPQVSHMSPTRNVPPGALYGISTPFKSAGALAPRSLRGDFAAPSVQTEVPALPGPPVHGVLNGSLGSRSAPEGAPSEKATPTSSALIRARRSVKRTPPASSDASS